MNSKLIYIFLCQFRKVLKEQYGPGSGLHAHHIIPRHVGGADDESNFTYLTVREHILAHYLLWRIYKNPNDLRAMKMLGGKLTPQMRSNIGKFCAENKIGFHSDKYSKEQRLEWTLRGLDTQKKSGSKQTFYYWSTEEGRKERASLGGKACMQSGNNTKWLYWSSPEGRSERARMGALTHKGKRCMYKPEDTTFKRIKPEDIDKFLKEGYIFGSPFKGKNQYSK